MTMAQLSDNLIYSAIAVYSVALLAYAAGMALRARAAGAIVPADRAKVAVSAGGLDTLDPVPAPSVPERSHTALPATERAGGRAESIAISLTVLALARHAAGVVARVVAAGRAPWGNMYEFSTAGALATSGAFLLMSRRPVVRSLGVWVTATVLLLLGLAVTVLYTPAGDLVPALVSYWLVVHVAAAIIAGGVFTVGAAATVAYLIRSRGERRAGGHPPRGLSGALPAAQTLERIAYAAHLFAFPVWTFAVAAGAIWAENAWGRYWGWDPKEIWAFITWVLYAGYLHAHATAGWRGKAAAWIALLGFVSFVFNFFGVNMWITGLHSYAGI